MYSRNFFTDDKSAPMPPENYSGVAIPDEDMQANESNEAEAVSARCENCREPCEDKNGDGLFGIFSGKSPLSSIFNGGGLKSLVSNIGAEEILIIATAMFLLLSKEGDKECGIMLLLLLII